MMNAYDGGEAVLEYADGEFRITRPGAFVVCAITARRIPVDSLKYWSVSRQEPYADADAAHQAYAEHGEF